MKYALITGASKGIGRAMAFELASYNITPILVARSEKLLNQLSQELYEKYKVNSRYFSMDLTQPQASTQIKQWCINNKLEVSILINNAGYGLWGYFEELSLPEQLNMMQLNMSSLIQLTHNMIPLLKKNKASHILNVASTTAYQPVPTMSVYAATKSFVVSFSQGLRHELRNSNIRVSCLSPGATDTNFIERAGMDAMKEVADKFSMTPEEVAKIAIKKMFKGEAEIIPGKLNLISSKLVNFIPSKLSAKASASIYEKHLQNNQQKPILINHSEISL